MNPRFDIDGNNQIAWLSFKAGTMQNLGLAFYAERSPQGPATDEVIPVIIEAIENHFGYPLSRGEKTWMAREEIEADNG